MGKSKIEWTNETWNPIAGCSLASPGCTNCYAMDLAGTRLRAHPTYYGLTTWDGKKPTWTGHIRFIEDKVSEPLHWRKPRKVFVNSMSDMFHEKVDFDWLDQLFAVMGLTPHHQYQILTKRAEIMHNYIKEQRLDEMNGHAGQFQHWDLMQQAEWPLPNVQLGVSCEDQKRADERVPWLLMTPAVTRFVSAEPLLGPIRFDACHYDEVVEVNALKGSHGLVRPHVAYGPKLDWIIVGGESGRRARPMDPDWARDIRDQCAKNGTKFFMKQMHKKGPIPDDLLIREWPE